MQPDDELCLCFHVTWRKVINYIRVHKIRVASRLSECQGAGTGCGWCRVFMQQLVEHIDPSEPVPDDLDAWLAKQMPAAQAYARRRANYIARGKVRSAEDLLSEDLRSEDLLSEDLLSEDLLSEDLLSEDLLSEDLLSEDLRNEDLQSNGPESNDQRGADQQRADRHGADWPGDEQQAGRREDKPMQGTQGEI